MLSGRSMYSNSCPVPCRFNEDPTKYPIARDEYLCFEGQSLQYPVDDGNPETSLNVHSIPGAKHVVVFIDI